MFQGHLTAEGWQEESSRVLEQRPKMHGHHTSSGVCLEHGDSVPMCASLDGVCVLQWGMIYSQVTGRARPWRSVGEALNCILFLTGSQWSSVNMGVIWSNFFFFISNRVAAFWTACSRFRDEDGRPARRLLQKSSREPQNWNKIIHEVTRRRAPHLVCMHLITCPYRFVKNISCENLTAQRDTPARAVSWFFFDALITKRHLRSSLPLREFSDEIFIMG